MKFKVGDWFIYSPDDRYSRYITNIDEHMYDFNVYNRPDYVFNAYSRVNIDWVDTYGFLDKLKIFNEEMKEIING